MLVKTELYSHPDMPTVVMMDDDSEQSRKIGFNKGYFTSIAGILTVVAMICAMVAMIALETGIHRAHDVQFRVNGTTFHEFSVVTSFVFLVIFIVLFGVSVCNLIELPDNALDAITIGHSAVWALLTFASSCFVAAATKYSPFAASAAFGFLESFALLAVIAVTTRRMVKRFRDGTSVHVRNQRNVGHSRGRPSKIRVTDY